MQIEIKKVKATKSIMEQVQNIGAVGLNAMEVNSESVLGWYIYKVGKSTTRYIFLLFMGEYRKMKFPVNISHEDRYEQIDNHGNRELHYFCKIDYGPRILNDTINFHSDKEMRDRVYNNLQGIVRIAKDKGQFFI